MTYLKSLLINFLTVFFVNHVVPGIDFIHYTKLPHIEGDIIFSVALGFLNSLVYPLTRLFNIKPTVFSIGILSLVITFVSYAILNLLPISVKVTTFKAYLWCSVIVWLVSFATNYMEHKRQEKLAGHMKKPDEEKKG